MGYIASEQITVFPSTRRSGYPMSRMMSEANLVGIVNKFLDTKGFVITDSFSTDENSTLDFNINGYYFSIDTSSSSSFNTIISDMSNVYAHISLETIPQTDYIELVGQDDNDLFSGLTIDDSEVGGTHTLKLLEKTDGGSFVIPEESKFKFTNKSIDVETLIVDGGEVV